MRYFLLNLMVALKRPFSAARRRERQQKFLEEMNVKAGDQILDLGGTPQFWKEFPIDVTITVVNLPGSYDLLAAKNMPHVTCVDGDACDMRQFPDKSFDICFSNSVIEHVGDSEHIQMFASEVRRLSDRYWVQTPSIWFPIEAHTHVLFWWFLPVFARRMLQRRWARILPEWNKMISGTTVILYNEFKILFEDAEIWTERFMLIPKSYVAYKAD